MRFPVKPYHARPQALIMELFLNEPKEHKHHMPFLRSRMHIAWIGIAALCFPTLSLAQIIVDESLTAQEVVESILLGEGVEIFNLTFSGDLDQIGSFDNNNSNILIENGMVMASGSCSNVIGPNDIGSSTTGGGNFGVNDIDLDLLSTFATNDAAVLEFDFIPSGDSLSFNYSFGSDEYNEYVCGSVNDAFGFFLSGPGINGVYSNGAVNLAIIPETDDTPVTINSVNNGNVGASGIASNCAQVDPNWMNNTAYYIDNATNSDPNATQLDGFTVSLVAAAAVQCGQTYHIKIAIADAGDTGFDSAVFIEQGSFESNAVVQTDLSIDVGGPDANTIYEDCGIAMLSFERPVETNLVIQEIVYINYGSSVATNGVDYGQPQSDGSLLPLPDSVVFPPFVSIVEFELTAAIDGIDEGPELVEMEIENVAACSGGGLTTYITFYVAEESTPFEVEGYETEMCLGDVIELTPLVSGGYGNYTYDWLCDGQIGAPFIFEPDVAGTWACEIIVGDTCGMPSESAIIEVEVLDFDPLEVNVLNDSIALSCNEMVDIEAIAVGGNYDTAQGGYYQYAWEDQDGNALFAFGFDPSILSLSDWQNVEEVFVTVTDACGFEASDSVTVVYNVAPIEILVQDTVLAECESVISITAEATGNGLLNYSWYSEEGLMVDSDPILNTVIIDDATFVLVVQNGCGQSATAEVTVIADCDGDNDGDNEELCAYVDLGDGAPIPDDQTTCFSWETEVALGDSGAIVSDASEISLFVEMEHSYMGDLTITYTCPNGQALQVVQQGGGGTNLGVPDQGDGTGPGIGWLYFWSPLDTNGTWAENAGGTLPAGSYESAQPFSFLEGCPVDGLWQIEICDAWGADDGYLFAWGIDFGDCSEDTGCTNPEACNYSPEAVFDDGSCTLPGCMDQGSCNYDPLAGCDDQSCLPYDALAGCMDQNACNFNGQALCADDSCVYPLIGNDCNGGAIACGGSTLWDAANQICVCAVGSGNDDCPSDLNGNGFVEVTDLLLVLGDFGSECPPE